MDFFDNMIGSEKDLSSVVRFWPVLLLSFICAFTATWLCKKIALKFGIVDRPDNLVKTHKEPVAYLGGIGMLAGLTAGVFAGIYVLIDMPDFAEALKWLVGILAGAAIACLVGVVDDIFDIKPRLKIFGQVLAAVALLLVGIRPDLSHFYGFFNMQMPENLEFFLGIPIVIFFVLGATNSLNLLDGLDGLCGGVTAIITVAMLLLSVHLMTWGWSGVADPVRIIICLGLVGSVFGFLPFNRYPAKIFMGDAGSMLLGFVMAAMMMLFANTFPRWWAASIVVFGLPILDTAVALMRRWINKRPIFVSDRGHIYDQMIDRGIPLKKTVGICYALAGMYALIGLTMSQIRTLYALVVYVIVSVISAIVVWKKGFLEMEGLRGTIKAEKEDEKKKDQPKE